MPAETSKQPPPAPDSLERFLHAQEAIYNDVVAELKNGRKRSHWMWFVFPQIAGLGHSATSRYYAINTPEQAYAYLHHPILGKRLRECAQLVYAIEGRTSAEIFGYPDDVKLRSSMTLFASISEADSIFAQVLEKYFNGGRDERTLAILAMLKEQRR